MVEDMKKITILHININLALQKDGIMEKIIIALCNTRLLVNLQLIAKSWPHKKDGIIK
jgi:hypothetical protein